VQHAHRNRGDRRFEARERAVLVAGRCLGGLGDLQGPGERARPYDACALSVDSDSRTSGTRRSVASEEAAATSSGWRVLSAW
jgi:hypothetical protein